jgi:hypothetical protein
MMLTDSAPGLKVDVQFLTNRRELRAIPCYYFGGFAGIPHPPFVTQSWQLPRTQPSQVLANFAAIAAVLIPQFAHRIASREV